jgi:hypothetical protein
VADLQGWPALHRFTVIYSGSLTGPILANFFGNLNDAKQKHGFFQEGGGKGHTLNNSMAGLRNIIGGRMID